MTTTQQETVGRPAGSRRRSGTRYRRALMTVAGLAVAAAVAGALSGDHPTGTAVADVVYDAAFAAVVTVAASRCRRYGLLWMTAIAFGLSRGWLWLPAGAALALAFASVFPRRAHIRWGALVGAVAVQVVMRWPSGGFHGFTAVAAAIAVGPVLWSGWRQSPARQRRRILLGGAGLAGLGLLLGLPLLVSGLAAKGPAEQGIALARSSLDRIEGGQAPVAQRDLARAASDLGSARDLLSGWWTHPSLLVPVLAQQQRALYHGTGAGAQLTSTASREARSFDIQSLRYKGGHIDVQRLESLSGPASRLDSAIASAQSELGRISSAWLVAPIDHRLTSLAGQLQRARQATDLAVLATQDAPAILGADGPRHYFVAFTTPAETRGLGGFIGAYGELTVDDGAIHLSRSGRAITLTDAPAQPRQLIAPADYSARYGAFQPQNHFGDVTYSPDLPSVEQVIAGLYPQVGGDHIDGVLVLDPYALGALLRFSGPITVPGLPEPLTAENAADVLLRQQYLTGDPGSQQRHNLLQAALDTGFRRLTSGSLPSPRTMSTVLGPEVRQGRLLFWTSHTSDHPLLEQLGLSGAFPEPGPASDLLAVTVANAANSKIDAYLHQQVSDVVHYDPATGHVTATVTIVERNDAPATGLPPYVIGSYSPDLAPGTNYTWLSLYSPFHLTAATLDGLPSGFSAGTPEDGTTAYSTFVTIPARSTSTLTVTLEGDLAPGAAYQMTIRQQPLANPQSFSMQVIPSHGWLYHPGTAARWSAGTAEIERHGWSFAR